jgi:hypothetical protein
VTPLGFTSRTEPTPSSGSLPTPQGSASTGEMPTSFTRKEK